MKKLLLKALFVVVILLVFAALVVSVVQLGKKLLGLVEDPRLRIAELQARAAHDDAEAAYSEYMKARAEADRLRQEVGLTKEKGENMLRLSVARGYTWHVRTHTMLMFALVSVVGISFLGVGTLAALAWVRG